MFLVALVKDSRMEDINEIKFKMTKIIKSDIQFNKRVDNNFSKEMYFQRANIYSRVYKKYSKIIMNFKTKI